MLWKQSELRQKLMLNGRHLYSVDTGRLRNSISHAVDGEAAYIGSNVEYAPYVELGTSRAKAHHMLQKAATEHSAEYKRLAEDAIQSAINNSQ